jgi:hypothetical protein
MLFTLSPNTPRFQVFTLLNAELIFFLEQSVPNGQFGRWLFTAGAIGQTCWGNAKHNSQKAEKDLTYDKFENLFYSLQAHPVEIRKKLLDVARNTQNLSGFFNTPNRDLLAFLPKPCFESLKNITTHLYCATKDLQGILNVAGGININAHFELFRAAGVNGNICKACGMGELAVFRASVAEGEQWRADYDHQLCKSKYPLFAVHPDNLIPLCSVCNQDAKKAKDLFIREPDQPRHAFDPFIESARYLIEIELGMLRDPEPTIKVVWTTVDVALLEKLETWDDVYEIKRRVEGRFRNLEIIIRNEIDPINYAHFESQVTNRARPASNAVLSDKEWAFWYQKLFSTLNQVDKSPFWEKSRFNDQQADEGSDYILERP